MSAPSWLKTFIAATLAERHPTAAVISSDDVDGDDTLTGDARSVSGQGGRQYYHAACQSTEAGVLRLEGSNTEDFDIAFPLAQVTLTADTPAMLKAAAIFPYVRAVYVNTSDDTDGFYLADGFSYS
jgi:hypothetical protein